MTSELKVDKITPASGTNTQIGEAGDTITIPSGCTITNSGTATNFGASLSGSTNNTVVTVTGANAMQGEANLTYDGSTLTVKPASNVHQLKLEQNNATDYWSLHADSGGGPLTFQRYTGGAETERLQLQSDGDLVQGTDSAGSDGRNFRWGSSVHSYRSGTADAYHYVFFNANGEIGRIRTSGSSTAYNTSSDYRLKENEIAISDGIARLKQLKPYRFNFKADADTTVDGFFAHEVSDIVPEAIDGDKDATNEDGSIKPQAIDQSKLVPLLTSALQEAITKIETLEAKVAALESE